MTQIAAIAFSLLRGDVLSIMNGFQLFSCTNLPREISRSIEKKFQVEVSRETVTFTSQYDQPGSYVRYRLNRTEYNKPGIEKMKQYVREQMGDSALAKTDKEKRRLVQTEMFLDSI